MKKINMLRKNKDFSFCYRKGRVINTKIFKLYYTSSKYNKRAGFSVSKKVGNSVVRNKMRRRMKESFDILLPQINKECSVIFVAKNDIVNVNFWDLHKTMKEALEKAKLLSE